MSDREKFDFWYAVNNTQVIRLPSGKLETFGNTVVHYHLLTEMMDLVRKTRVREGRIEVFRPEIITPQHMGQANLEGFGEEAEAYMDWLRQHQQELYILKYGFVVKKEVINESVISEGLDTVLDRVHTEMNAKDDPLSALVSGVEEPWEVCLLKLMVDIISHSAGKNMSDLRQDPSGARQDVEQAFREAARDKGRINALARMLKKAELFEEYEDRFFSLVRSHE